jgi:BirA family biotin operon repressor/biotin-[acetyl-CoA-carboxylase] ligase
VLFYSSVGSTNDIAADLAAAADAEGTVVIADAQTAGRGRRGHTWFSPAGSGLYISLVLAPGRAAHAVPRAVSLLTIMAGAAIAEAVEAISGLRATIKWPNDLLVGRRKLAGILAEGVVHPGRAGINEVVLGYGLNVSAAAFPSELSDRVTSLESELGRPIDRAMLAAETIAAIAQRYDDLLAGRFDAILDAWRQRAPDSRGAAVTWDSPQGPQSGTTDGVDGDGALLVRRGTTLHRIVSGEVRWEGMRHGAWR